MEKKFGKFFFFFNLGKKNLEKKCWKKNFEKKILEKKFWIKNFEKKFSKKVLTKKIVEKWIPKQKYSSPSFIATLISATLFWPS